jgi:hypothetical protein
MFKVGDKVRQLTGPYFGVDGLVGTVILTPEQTTYKLYEVKFEQTEGVTVDLEDSFPYREGELELVEEEA